MEESLRIISAVAEALDFAHGHSIIHRDIKPENILLENGRPVVADFGVARAITGAARERLTATGFAVGTPLYMSPEQAYGEDRLDARSDLYSLACVLYERLAGDPPFTASTPEAVLARKIAGPPPNLRVVRESVTPAVEDVIQRALARSPAECA